MGDEDWCVECSDDEKYEVKTRTTEYKSCKIWEPSGDRISQLYQKIDKDRFIPLKWVCPGKRTPSTPSNSNDKAKTAEINTETVSKVQNTLFDFDEESPQVATTVPKIKRKTVQGPKQTVQLDKVLTDLRRYQRKEKNLAS